MKYKMDRRLPKLSKQPACVNCAHAFVLRDRFLCGPKSPLLLHCGHSMCESCIRSILRNKDAELVCRTCSEVSEITSTVESLDTLREEFPLNLYLLGKIQFQSVMMKSDDSMISFKKNKQGQSGSALDPSRKDMCYECGRITADTRCQQCNVIYCNLCFDKVHRSAKSLQMHKKEPLSLINKNGTDVVVEFCQNHGDQKLEFYCPHCVTIVCAYCVISDHMNHGAISMKEKNASLREELNKSLDEATEVLRRLQFTQKKAVTSSKKTDVDGKAVVTERAIISHFAYLHGCLQLQEAKLLAQLKETQNCTANSLQNVITELEISIKETEEAIVAGKAACEQNVAGNIDFHSVIENLKRLKNIPCHLYISEASKKQEAYRFSVNPDIKKTLEEHCQVTLPDNRVYVLKTKDELPENYVVEKLPDVSSAKKVAVKKPVRPVENVPERRKSVSQSSDKSESSRTSLTVCKNGVSAVHDLHEGVIEQVVISHLTSPSEFYVHRKGCALELMNFASQFKTYVSVREDVPGAVEIENIYLVKYKMDDNWYRARVTAAVDSEQFEVFYIDYGNKEVTSVTNMRSIPERFLRVPPLALRCSLFGCVPVGGKWSTEAINIMVNITSDAPLTMVVMSCKSPTHCEVDLCRMECGILSFRDALVFLELATLSETGNYPMPRVKEVEFFTDVDLKTGSHFSATVSAVTCPDDFYVQRVNEGDNFFHNLMQKMNDEYKIGGSARSDLIYSPKVGMAVAALSSEDNKWYRAKVIKLAGKRMVEVFFIDNGKTEEVFWTDVRTLHDEFLRLSKQAIHCTLSDVAPITGTEWSAEACEAFRMMVSQGHSVVSLVVVEAVATGKSNVILYERYNEIDVCINALLVKNGQAKSTGVNSTVVEFNRVNFHDSEARTVTPAPKTDSASKPTKKVQARRTVHEVDRVNRTRKQERVTSTSSSPTDDESSSLQTDNDSEDIFRLPVSILNVTSPGRFFITIPSLEKQIKRLTEEMNDFYSRSSSSNVTWKKDAKCAVFRYSDMNWYRGIVLEVLSDTKVKVMLKDIASEEVVNKESVQILDSKFCDVRDGAILCHLSKIKAPGGNDKWPGIACEEFTSEVTKYQKLYISKTGDVDNGSLPVELWAKHVRPAGPLDPIVEEWITVNEYLLNKGYALPDKSYEHERPTASAADFMKHLSEAKSISVEKAIVNWLDQSYQSGRHASSTPTDTNKFLAAIDRSATPTPSTSHAEDDDRQSVVSNLPSVASTSTRLRSGSEINAISDWLQPVPFKNLHFQALPTYIDDECCIYLQDPRQSKPTLDVLEKALMSRYRNTKPSPSDMYWFPGQLCVAQFHVDQKWYRAKVISVNSEDSTVKVYFVDYGNVEICKASELRKNICMGHIPVQCHKCRTDGIIPISEDGKWPTATLDFIHLTIVDKPCFVELKEPTSPDGGYVVMSLKCQGGLDLVEMLMSMHYATYVIDCDAIGGHSSKHDDDDDDGDDEREDEDVIIVKQTRVPSLAWYRLEKQMVSSKMDLSFIPMTLPDDINEFGVETTAVVSSTEYVVNLTATDHPELSEVQKKYGKVLNTMQEDAPKQPILRKPYLGKACCAQFTEDGKWYRAVVISKQKDQLQVQYIDYGNIETLPLEQVKQIRNEWVDDIPAQGILCVLSDITEVKPFNTEELKRLTNCMLDCSLLMKIKSRAPSCVYVELYNSDGQLAYQPLLDANLLAQSRGTSN